MTTIRKATAEDIPSIVLMGARFIESEYPEAVRFNSDQIATLSQSLIDGGGAAFVAERAGALVGMMGLTTYKHAMSGETIATEIVWWMEPSYRGDSTAMRMFAAGKTWAREHGASKLQMIAPSDKVGKFYERLGFRKIEVHYQTDL